MDARFTGPMPPHSSSKSLVVALKGKLRTKMDLCGGRRLRQRGEAASLRQRQTHAEPYMKWTGERYIYERFTFDSVRK